MQKLLIATTNPGKLKEIKSTLIDLPLKLLTLKDLEIIDEVVEDGQTFEENAIKKAWFYSQKSGLLTIADDGGLEINALNDEPGVKSKRWANGKENPTDEELIEYTLGRLKGISKAKRGAQLRTVVALAFPSGEIFTSEGKIRGMIAEKPAEKWTRGYPYRALLYLPQIRKFYNEKELNKEEQEKYAHRVQALKKLKKIIKEKLFYI